MPKDYLLEFTDRADVAFNRLNPRIQQQINGILHQIELTGPRRPYVSKLKGLERMYLARATSDIVLIIQVEDDVIRILDIVSHDKLRST